MVLPQYSYSNEEFKASVSRNLGASLRFMVMMFYYKKYESQKSALEYFHRTLAKIRKEMEGSDVRCLSTKNSYFIL